MALPSIDDRRQLQGARLGGLHILGPGAPREHPYTSVARIVDGELAY